MDENIIKGPISNVSYKEAYDDNGKEYRNYRFTLDEKKLECRLPRLEHLSEGDMMIVEYKKEGNIYEMVSGLHTMRNYKWGNAAALRKYKNESDNFKFVEGKIIEKRKLDVVMSTPRGRGYRLPKFTIVLEDKNFTVPGDIAKKLHVNDFISAVIVGDYASIIYNKTTGKWLGSKGPYYIAFLLAALGFAAFVYYLHTIGNTTFVRPKTTVIVFDAFLLWFGLVNFYAYRSSNAARRFLNGFLKKQ